MNKRITEKVYKRKFQRVFAKSMSFFLGQTYQAIKSEAQCLRDGRRGHVDDWQGSRD